MNSSTLHSWHSRNNWNTDWNKKIMSISWGWGLSMKLVRWWQPSWWQPRATRIPRRGHHGLSAKGSQSNTPHPYVMTWAGIVPKSHCSQLARWEANSEIGQQERKARSFLTSQGSHALGLEYGTGARWYRGHHCHGKDLPCKEKKRKKEKVAAWEVPTLNNAVFNWYHRGLCAVCMLLVFIIESPNSNDLKGIWLFYINHKLYSRGWEQVGRYPGVVALRSSHYNHPAKSKEKP